MLRLVPILGREMWQWKQSCGELDLQSKGHSFNSWMGHYLCWPVSCSEWCNQLIRWCFVWLYTGSSWLVHGEEWSRSGWWWSQCCSTCQSVPSCCSFGFCNGAICTASVARNESPTYSSAGIEGIDCLLHFSLDHIHHFHFLKEPYL